MNLQDDPELYLRMENLELSVQGLIEGVLQGNYRSPFLGHSLEFDSHREYRQGDDLRHLNWKLWARHKKLFIKQYRAETNLHLYMLLDSSASMKTSQGPTTKWRYAQRMAGALAWLGRHLGDAPGLMLYDEKVKDWLPPKATTTQFYDILSILSQREADGGSESNEAISQGLDLLRRRGVVVWISDFFDRDEETVQLMGTLKSFGHDVIAIQILDPWEVELPNRGQYEFRDLETGEKIKLEVSVLREKYQKEVNEWKEYLSRESARLGVDFISMRTDESLIKNLELFLLRRLELVS